MDAASGAAASCEPSVPPGEEKASQDGQIYRRKVVNPPKATSDWETIAKKSWKNVSVNQNQTHFFMEKREKKSYNIFI